MNKLSQPHEKRLPVIVLLGAGSRIFAFNMCTDICQTEALKGAEVRLVDVDGERLDTAGQVFKVVSSSRNWGLKISQTTNRRAALPGADFVIVSVARERIECWEKDLAISRRYGIVETQGECGGPGGLSLTLRNIPLLLDIARDVERLAPGAVILNFSNPMTRICRAISRYTKVMAVGLCHGLLGVQVTLNQLLGRNVLVRGCGINHFNWIFDIRWADSGESAWDEATRAFVATDLPGFIYTQELFNVFGRIVTPGDGHMADFMYHWRGDADGFNPRYKLHMKEMNSYRLGETEWKLRLNDYIEGRKNPMDNVGGLSGEGAIPIVCAMSGLIQPYDEISVNIPNRGAIPGLSADALVEVPGHVSAGSIEGEQMDELPAGLRSLIQRQLDIAELAIEAAVEGSYQKALQALAIDPIVQDLRVAELYLNDVLAEHRDLLPQFA
jgi:alpha-galactosidase